MSKRTRASDVFLSYSPRNEMLAAQVKARLADEGLLVVSPRDLGNGRQLASRFREAIAESQAMVVIVSEPYVLPTNLVIEVGAALAWEKPIFVLASNADPESLPAFLQEGKVFSYQSLDAVIDSILQSKLELSERETQWLKQWYEDRKVPLDQLMARPALLDDLSARFAKT